MVQKILLVLILLFVVATPNLNFCGWVQAGDSPSGKERYNEAARLFKKGKLAKSKKLLLENIYEDVWVNQSYIALGRIEEVRGNYAESQHAFEMVIKNNHESFYYFWREQLQSSKISELKKRIQQFGDLGPGTLGTIDRIGNLFVRQKKYKEALIQFMMAYIGHYEKDKMKLKIAKTKELLIESRNGASEDGNKRESEKGVEKEIVNENGSDNEKYAQLKSSLLKSLKNKKKYFGSVSYVNYSEKLELKGSTLDQFY